MLKGTCFYFRIKRGGSKLLSSVIYFYDQLFIGMEEITNIDFDSDDSDDFSDIFENKAEETEDESKISPGDIVWAEFRNLHWPALVRRIIKKDNKIVVWYLDSPGLSFKLSRRKILSFKNPEISQRIRKEARESAMKEKHDKVLSSTLTFIRRRAEGCNDNPAEFFDSNIPYLSFKNFKMNPNSSSYKIANSASASFKSNGNGSDDSDDDVVVDSDSDEFNMSKVFSEIQNDSDDIPYDKERADSIVSCIIAGRTDKHLIAVQAGRVSSEFQRFFEDAMQSDRRKLWYDSKTCEVVGIIKDQDKLVEISTYLMNLYEKTVEGGKWVVHRYVTSVWLPESIEKAICILDEESKSPNKLSTSTESNLNENSNHKESKPSTSLILDEGNDIIPKQEISKAKKCASKSKLNLSPSKKNRGTKSSSAKFSSSKEKATLSEITRIDNPNKDSFSQSSLEELGLPKAKKLKVIKPFVQGTRSSPRKKL